MKDSDFLHDGDAIVEASKQTSLALARNCTLCDGVFWTFTALDHHMVEKHGWVYTCKECSATFTHKEIYDMHTDWCKSDSKIKTYTYTKHNHDASVPILIGGFNVWLGAGYDITGKSIDSVNPDLLLPLNGSMPNGTSFGKIYRVAECELKDMGGVPDGWNDFIDYIAEEIISGTRVMAWCQGGHGRTGTFAASLIAKMEPDTEDPIEAIRERHCDRCVESSAQAKAVFGVRGVEVPSKWVKISKGYSGGSLYYGDSYSYYAGNSKVPDPDALKALESAKAERHIMGWSYWESTNTIDIWLTSRSVEDIKGVKTENIIGVLTDVRTGKITKPTN